MQGEPLAQRLAPSRLTATPGANSPALCSLSASLHCPGHTSLRFPGTSPHFYHLCFPSNFSLPYLPPVVICGLPEAVSWSVLPTAEFLVQATQCSWHIL